MNTDTCPKCHGMGGELGPEEGADAIGFMMAREFSWYACERCDGSGVIDVRCDARTKEHGKHPHD
jgi:DnaJ-class molecular chaperone